MTNKRTGDTKHAMQVKKKKTDTRNKTTEKFILKTHINKCP